MREPQHPARDDLALVSVLHALSDPTRLDVARALALSDERPCGDFHGVGGVSVATISRRASREWWHPS